MGSRGSRGECHRCIRRYQNGLIGIRSSYAELARGERYKRYKQRAASACPWCLRCSRALCFYGRPADVVKEKKQARLGVSSLWLCPKRGRRLSQRDPTESNGIQRDSWVNGPVPTTGTFRPRMYRTHVTPFSNH